MTSRRSDRERVARDPLRWFGGERPPLTHRDDAGWWLRVAEAVGEEPYVCKAAYVCGVVRQAVESAALLDAVGRHTSAAQVLLGAVEVLGRAITGHTGNGGMGERLEGSLDYLIGLQKRTRHLKPPILDPKKWIDVRNFTGHGAVYHRTERAELDRHGFVQLAYLLTRALDRFWLVPVHRELFSRCTILPGWTVGRPVFVEDVLRHLRAGHKPSNKLPTDLPFLDVAAARRWPREGVQRVLDDLEKPTALSVRNLPSDTPAVTGFGGSPSAFTLELMEDGQGLDFEPRKGD
jgi:hypothetical protein